MKQFYLKCLFLGFLTLFSFHASAWDCIVDGIYYNLNKSDNTASVTKKNTWSLSYTGSVIIPSTIIYNGTSYNVTSIGGSAFSGCSGLTSVTIPNSVTSIGGSAFQDCSGLTSVTIPESVTSIGNGAFEGCSGLTSVTINSSVIVSKSYNYSKSLRTIFGNQVKEYIFGDKVTSIGDYVFYGCSGLTSVTIPESVTSIGESAFEGCSGLTSVTIPESVTSIENYVFQYCSGLTSVTIPESVTSIGESAFEGCSGLTSVTIPRSVTSIGNGAFEDCSSLTSVTINSNAIVSKSYNPNDSWSLLEAIFGGQVIEYILGDEVTSIGGCAFFGCSDLTSVTIGNSVTSIGGSAFSGCSGLTSIEIPNSVTSIGEFAFSGCSGLTSVTIGNSVTSIGGYAFYGCSGLTSIEIPNSVTSIGGSAFYGCSGLTSVTIPESVTSIGNGAFEDCSSLTSVTIPESVTSIGEFAFSGCSGLTSVTIPESVTSIGMYAFRECSSLTSVTIGNGVTRIGDSMFYGCSGLTSIEIPNSVTSIGGSAFYGCSGLTSVTIPESVTSIGNGAFEDCSSLTSVTINSNAIVSKSYNYSESLRTIFGNQVKEYIFGDKVTSIGGCAFQGCSGLTSIEIPNSVTSIGGSAFSGCSGLTSIEIPNSVTSIGYGAFEGCSSLTSITIPNSVTSIGNGAFSGCSGLTSITIPNSVTSIGYGAFEGCSSLTSVTSYIEKPFNIYDVFDTSVYTNAILYVPPQSLGLYEETYGWNAFENIVPFDGGYSLTLNVTDEQNQDVTDKVSIVWYDGDGKELGTGSTLNGIEDGAEIYYTVLLDEELGRIYREVKMQKAEANNMTCQLEKIGRVVLAGRVSATDIDKTTATVGVKQMLNGKWEQSYQTQTNAQGVFQVEVYDDVTDITISGDGYFDATLHRDGFNGNGNVGTIPLNLITGFSIAANIDIQKTVGTGEAGEASAWNDGLNNIEFSLTNSTKNREITDFTVQNGSVIIKSGADVGDEIRLVAKSKQGVFADAETTFVIEEGTNAFDLLLTERGGVDAVCDLSNNGGTNGYLYDSDGALASMGSYTGETLSLRHLPKGVYTLVSIGRSQLLGSMTNLSDLASVGLKEGEDYVATRVEVADGEITEISVNEVPKLEETKFYYTTNNTYFNANQSSIIAGNYLTLSTHLDFKPEYADKVNGVTLSIDLPEGCQMVENSAIVNRQPVAHSLNGKRVSFVLTPEQYQSQLRFCIIPSLNKSYTITAIASFDKDGRVQQPIGTAQFEAKGLSLSVPVFTASSDVTISGTAKGHSEVSIYDNDVLIGKTSSKADGTWTTEAELFKPRSHSFHDIYAKIITENGMELTSETKQVEFDKNCLVPAKVTMLYNGRNVIYNLLQGTTSSTSYSYNPSINSFTFLADFTRNDTTQIKNVNIKVLNTDGTVRTLPAIYDGKQNHWVATTNYESANRLPQNVTVEYEYYPTLSDEDREEDLMDEANKLVSCAYLIKDYFDKNVEMTVIEDSENYVLFECKTDESQTPLLYRIEGMDYSAMEELMKTHQFTYVESNDSIVGTYWESTDNGMTVYGVDINNATAFKLTLYNPTAHTKVKAIDLEPIFESLKESVRTGEFLDPSFKFIDFLDLILDIKEYWSVKGDFDNMCNTIIRYQDNLLKVNQKTFKAILAKCPDGSYKLSKEKREQYYNALQSTSYLESIFAEQYYDYLQEYKNKLLASVGTFIGTLGVGKALGALGKSSKFVSSKMNRKFYNFLNNNIFSSYVFRTTSAKILSSVIGTSVNFGVDQIGKIFDYKDFNKVNDKVLSWSSKEYSGLLQNYISLQNGIKHHYAKCEKDPNHPNEEEDEPTDDKSEFRGKGSTPLIDPSGYVYEAVLSNRLEGVTTTCYQQENGEAVVWNAEDYSQKNPLKTDEAGFYRWDVPQGMWQVKYEKEGYETAYSEWLPVPPPQLDVNVGMKQSTPSSVTQMRGVVSGITIDFSKYMLPTTLNETNITVTRNGLDEKGHIELMNEEKEPKGEQSFASKVKFVPESLFNTSDLVIVTVHKEVESYCGVKMLKDHVETVKIESEVKSILADSAVTVPYQGQQEMRILVLPKDASAGRTLHVRSSSPMIASVSADDITIGQDGAATLMLGGELPGGAVIDFSVKGTDVTATSKVQVTIGHDLVATPTASILSGETIESGTMLVLSCATEGATIYYTLDGSCPCDEATRHRYDGPITIASDVIVKAMAVKDGMDDSDVATFIYMVNGINNVLAANNIRVDGKDKTITIIGAEGASCHIYDLQGQLISSRSNLTNQSVFKMKAAGIYLLQLTLPDGQTTACRVLVK